MIWNGYVLKLFICIFGGKFHSVGTSAPNYWSHRYRFTLDWTHWSIEFSGLQPPNWFTSVSTECDIPRRLTDHSVINATHFFQSYWYCPGHPVQRHKVSMTISIRLIMARVTEICDATDMVFPQFRSIRSSVVYRFVSQVSAGRAPSVRRNYACHQNTFIQHCKNSYGAMRGNVWMRSRSLVLYQHMSCGGRWCTKFRELQAVSRLFVNRAWNVYCVFQNM